MMDLPEVKAFNAELSGLYDNKPPISKAKMSAITKGAIKAIKVYKHVVHSVEKFIQKCKPEYKVPGLYVIDSIVRQSRHQFGQDKDVFAPRFAKNMQQTFANLFRCPPEDKRNIIRVLNLWQKNNVFSPQVIQPLMDMADPSHPLHQEIQQQNNTANGSSLNISHNTDKSSPGASQHSPPMSSPMGGDQFQDEPSGQSNKFRKLLNDFEYDSEDEPMTDAAPPHSHSHSTSHTSHSTSHTSHAPSHTSHATSHTTHTSQSHGQMPQPPLPSQNTADAMASILTNPEIMRQLHSLQAQMQMMTGMQLPNLMPMMTDVSQMQQNPNQQNLPFLSSQQDQKDGKEDGGNNESDIEFVDAGPTVIEIPDANDSRSPSPKSRRHRSRSKSPKRRRRGSRSRSRSPRRRRDRERDRDRDRDRDKDRDKDREKNYKEREAEREKQREREKKGLPPIKKDNLSVCSTTLWVGHLSKLATPEELSDLFGAVGGVQHIDVVAPRGCAFVVMERRRDAYKAKQKLNKHKLHSKEITVAWAPGKGVKGREWKDYWEAELGVSYLPWHELHAQWSMGALSLDAIEDGGVCDEETLPPWLPPRIMPKSMLDNMSMMGVGMLPLPPGMPPRPTPDMSAGAMSSPLAGGALGMPPAAGGMPAMPPLPNMAMQRMPPPGMGAGLPPGLAAGMPPGLRPAMPTGVPGLGGEGGLPNTMIRFPPGMPPQSMGQTGMVGGFLGGLLGVGGMLGGVPVLHLPPALHAPQQQQRAAEQTPADDAMDLDTEDHTDDNHTNTNDIVAPSALLPDQIQALLSIPPPKFNASEPPPGFNASEPPPFAPAPPADDKLDEDRKERDRRDRDRGERRDRDRDRRDRDREQRRDRERPDRNERGPRGDRDRDGGRDDRRDRGGRRDRDRDRDRERDRFGNNRDANRSSREKSPRAASSADAPEKSLQERLWEMANGKTASNGPRADDKSEPERERERGRASSERPLDGPQDNDGDDASSSGGWQAAAAGPRPPLLGPPFRPELRMRGPPRLPMSGPPGPWMEGPPGPGGPGGPFGPRFNGMGPPSFNRPPFERPPFDGPRFDGPPRFERPPFNRMPFDMNRPPFDGARPPFDGPRPPFDGPRPPFDGPRPPFDGPRPMFDGPRPPFDGPRPPFDGPPGRQFDGDRPFDGPPEFFDRNNRRFDDREQFNERGWDRRDRPDWDRRERHSRERDERFNRRDERGDRAERPPARRGADDRPRTERPRDDRARDDRARDDKTRDDKPRDDKTRDDKPRDDRNRDDRPRDDRPRDDKKEDRPRDDRPKNDKPKEDRPREERRRDKDRKSRWGAAEETVVEEPQPIETQPTDNMETKESNTYLEVPVAIDVQPAEMNDVSDRAESGKGEQNEHSESTESRIDDDTKVDIDEPRLEDTRFESREKSPQVTENSDRYEETKEEQSHEREESNYEPENKESFEEPAPQSAPVSDLYDADEAIDTSFGAARSESIEAPSKQIEPPNESHDIPKEVFEASKEDFEAPGIPDTPKGVTSPPLDSALAASEDIFSETRDTSEAKETSEVREASEAKEASEPVPDAKEGAA